MAAAAFVMALTLGPVTVSGTSTGMAARLDDAADIAAVTALAERELAAATASRSASRDDPEPAAEALAAPAPEPDPTPDLLAVTPTASLVPKPEPKAEAETKAEPEPEAEPKAEPEPEPEPKKPAPVGGLNQTQMDHAATIVRVGQDMDLPDRAYVVAIATALQETYLRNLANPAYPESSRLSNEGSGADHDSVGLFQQRPVSGWGTVAECMDPEYAARKFYERLRTISGWDKMPITVAAQKVQVSAFPDHYAKHEPLARQIVDALT